MASTYLQNWGILMPLSFKTHYGVGNVNLLHTSKKMDTSKEFFFVKDKLFERSNDYSHR